MDSLIDISKINVVDILMAIAVYCVGVLAITQSLKKWRFASLRFNFLYVSWVVGLLLYLVAAMTKFAAFSPVSFMLFVIITLGLNQAYAKDFVQLKKFLKDLFNLK